MEQQQEMTNTDMAIRAAIEEYRKEHGVYPPYYEVSPAVKARMNYEAFTFHVPWDGRQIVDSILSRKDIAPHTRIRAKEFHVPILVNKDYITYPISIRQLAPTREEANKLAFGKFTDYCKHILEAQVEVFNVSTSSGKSLFDPRSFFCLIRFSICGPREQMHAYIPSHALAQ